jgi:6-pyruvoyltetrahydropterin/6-carboxytetrahydropterin synthase
MFNSNRTVLLTRRVTFSSSHRLHAAQLSDSENKRIFDKCNHINGHGHNYVLYITIQGAPDPVTGMIINIVELRDIIEQTVLSKVDHKHLNLDIDIFKTVNPTVENMVLVFWDWISAALPDGMLYELKLYETENNIAVFRGHNTNNLT